MRTDELTHEFLHARQQMHLIMGAASLWTRPPALYLCSGPSKRPTSAHELHATSFSTSATVGGRLSSPRRHLWNSHHLHNRDVDHHAQEQLRNLHGQRDHGNLPVPHDRNVDDPHNLCNDPRSPCSRATGESPWSYEQSGPWEKTSATRMGSTKSATTSLWFIPAVMPSIMGLPTTEETHREV